MIWSSTTDRLPADRFYTITSRQLLLAVLGVNDSVKDALIPEPGTIHTHDEANNPDGMFANTIVQLGPLH